MWQSVLQFLQEWMKRSSWVASVGIVLGFLLFLTGMTWKKPCYRKLGLLAMGVCVIVGILLYFYG